MNVGERFAWVRAVIAAQPRPTLAEAAVAVVLAEHYNAKRCAAWPAQSTMAALLGRSRRTVRTALAGLEQRGLVERISDGGPHESAHYALVLPSEGAPSRPPMASRPAISRRPGAPSEGAPSRPEQVSRSEHVGKPYPAAGARSADAARTRGGSGKRGSGRRNAPAAPVRL